MGPENTEAAFILLAILADIKANRNNDENYDILNRGIDKLNQQIEQFRDHENASKLIEEGEYIKEHLLLLRECIVQNEVRNRLKFNREVDDLITKYTRP